MAALTGFEALPPRSSGRAAKRRRLPDAPAAGAAASSPPAPGSLAALAAFSGSASDEPLCYEYLDHTADVQIHAWGASLGDALCGAASGLWGYMTEPTSIELDPSPAGRRRIEARGRDAAGLLFNFLDACLYAFATEDFVARVVRCEECSGPGIGAGGAAGGDGIRGDGGGGDGAEFYISAVA